VIAALFVKAGRWLAGAETSPSHGISAPAQGRLKHPPRRSSLGTCCCRWPDLSLRAPQPPSEEE